MPHFKEHVLYFTYRRWGEIYLFRTADGKLDDPECIESRKFRTLEERAEFLEREYNTCKDNGGQKLMGPEELKDTTSPQYEQYLSAWYRKLPTNP